MLADIIYREITGELWMITISVLSCHLRLEVYTSSANVMKLYLLMKDFCIKKHLDSVISDQFRENAQIIQRSIFKTSEENNLYHSDEKWP